ADAVSSSNAAAVHLRAPRALELTGVLPRTPVGRGCRASTIRHVTRKAKGHRSRSLASDGATGRSNARRRGRRSVVRRADDESTAVGGPEPGRVAAEALAGGEEALRGDTQAPVVAHPTLLADRQLAAEPRPSRGRAFQTHGATERGEPPGP